MQTTVPGVFEDPDEAEAAVQKLERTGAWEEVVEGPDRVFVADDATSEQAHDVVLGIAVGAPVVAALMFALSWALLPGAAAFGPTGTLILAHGAVFGAVVGGIGGGIWGFFLHEDAGTEVELAPGDVLVTAHAVDPETATEIMASHGARLDLRSGDPPHEG